MVIGEPLRMRAIVAVFFGPSAAIRRARSCGSATVSPSTAVMTSPLLIAGGGGRRILLRLRHQRAGRIFRPEIVGDVRGHSLNLNPDPAARHEPFSLSCCTTFLTTSLAMAKPMPTLPPDGEKIAVLTPTTSPSALKVGPPELP